MKKISIVVALLLALFLAVTTIAEASAEKVLPHSMVSRPNAIEGPTAVEVAVWLIDIDSIDSSSQNFVANVFLKLRWKDPRLAGLSNGITSYKTTDIWNPRMQIANEIGLVRKTLPDIVFVEPDGTATYRQRYIGPFSQPMDLNDFPFDTHTFTVQFVSSTNHPGDIEFIKDPAWVSDGLPEAGGIANDISLPDWKIESFKTETRAYTIAPGAATAGYAFDFVAKRDVSHYLWKVFIPLLFIVMMSWSVFWIDPSQSGTQIAVATTSMLTLIAYRFAIDSQVPRVPYMTKLDQFTVVATALVFLCLVQAIITSRLNYVGKEDVARKTDKWSRIVFPIVFIIGLTIALIE